MSASHSDDQASHETHPHPPMPAVTDEAADTPTWVPISGVALFVLMLIFGMWRAHNAPPPPDAAAVTTDEAYPSEGGGAPAPSTVIVAPAGAQ